MYRILVVCTGNTCRSPMLAALLQAQICQVGLADDITVWSAGLNAANHSPATVEARQAMAGRGLNLKDHQAHQLLVEDIEIAHVILTMTAGHKQAIINRYPQAKSKTHTLAQFAGLDEDVSDPYGGDAVVYEKCAKQLELLLAKVWPKIVGLAGKKEKYVEQNTDDEERR